MAACRFDPGLGTRGCPVSAVGGWVGYWYGKACAVMELVCTSCQLDAPPFRLGVFEVRVALHLALHEL